MADSDGSPPDTTSDPSITPPSPAARPVAPAPRSNPPNINAGKDKPAPAGPPGFNDFLEWMRTMSGDAPAPTADQRTLIPKERKKFQRQDTETRAEKLVPTPPAPSAPVEKAPDAPSAPTEPSAIPVMPTAEVRTSQDAPRTAAAEPAQERVRRGQQAATQRNLWVNVLIQAGMAALLVVSFFVGRASVKKVAAPAAAPAAPEMTTQDGKITTNVLSAANATLIDHAMAAIQDSRFKEATEDLDKVQASGEHVRGLAFQRAQLAAFAGENNRAVPLLNEALNEGENLGETYNLRATLSSRTSVFRGAGSNDYETASKLDPFEARTFFYWGSALRRAGKSQAAIGHIQQAIDRLREPTAEGFYRMCLRVTKVEVGQEKEFSDELARQLALPHPNIDWLFTAAAIALRDAKYDVAAGLLDRAEACGDPDGFKLRLQDFYFSQFSTRKELARFFAKLKPAAAPSPESSAAPLTGLDVPTLPPPASPGPTVAR